VGLSAPSASAAPPASGVPAVFAGRRLRGPSPRGGSAPSTLRSVVFYLVKAALLLLAVSVLVFVLVDVSPIDPVQANVGQSAYAGLSAEKKAQLAGWWGAGTPVWERYLSWLSCALHGDLGTSLRFNMPVAQVLAQRASTTLLLMFSAWLASGAVGFLLGAAAGARAGSAFDRVVRGVCLFLASTPSFWIGMLLLSVFSVWLGWFPVGFSAPISTGAAGASAGDVLRHLALPALTLSIVGMPNIALHTREKMADVMGSDYVRFSRARGEGERAVVCRHGLRNVALPALTLQCASVAELFGGSVLVEQVFSYPGLGQAAVTAATGGDASLLVGIAVASALLVFCGNACADLLYRVIDPRMRTGRRHRRRRVAAGARDAADEGAAATGAQDTADEDVAARKAPAAGLRAFAAKVRTASPPSQGARASRGPSPTVFHVPSHVCSRRAHAAVAALCAALLLAVVVVGAFLEPAAAVTDLSVKNLPPGLAHLFGTDQLGRDMLVRTVAGLSTSIRIGLLAAIVSSLVALVLGFAAALGGPKVDACVTWLVDLATALPHIVLLLLVSFALGRGYAGVAVGIAVTHWPNLCRVVRAEVLQVRAGRPATIARQLGRTRLQVALRHVLPAVFPQFIVGLVLLFPHAILHEAAITFLGFGLPAETAAVGVVLSESMGFLASGMWWLSLFPGAALVAVALLFSKAGSSLQALLGFQQARR
jgi:ABC-type dipeptide/oligopeptide/nickel transport system permease component